MSKSEQFNVISETTYFNDEKRTFRDTNKYALVNQKDGNVKKYGLNFEKREKERENKPFFLLQPRGCVDAEGVLLGKFQHQICYF